MSGGFRMSWGVMRLVGGVEVFWEMGRIMWWVRGLDRRGDGFGFFLRLCPPIQPLPFVFG